MFQLNFLKLVVIFIRALYQFVAGAEDELSLQVGAEVTVLRQGDYEGWLLGQIAGTKGIFPESYVERFERKQRRRLRKTNPGLNRRKTKEEMKENKASKTENLSKDETASKTEQKSEDVGEEDVV